MYTPLSQSWNEIQLYIIQKYTRSNISDYYHVNVHVTWKSNEKPRNWKGQLIVNLPRICKTKSAQMTYGSVQTWNGG